MGLWDFLFGGGTFNAGPGINRQLPSGMVAQEFGEVNVRRHGGQLEVLFTLLMEPSGAAAEGWQTGVALDASGSMTGAFGRRLVPGPAGPPPESLRADYLRRGLMRVVEQQGQQFPIYSDACKQELVALGHLAWSSNEMEPLARRFTSYLASNLDTDGGTTVIYWACGDGRDIEILGDFTAEQCETAHFAGPRDYSFGEGTYLTPAVRYFADRFADARQGMYIFLTDGELTDLDNVKGYTTRLCREIADGRRNPLKCVLVGLGEHINEGQMEELDDLDSGTDVDLWDHKIAREMRDLLEIFAEVVSEHQIVAPTARIYSDTGELVKNFADGLPAKVTFSMPASSRWFELEVAGERIRQPVVES